MRTGNLRSDIQSQPQTLPSLPDLSAAKRLEDPVKHFFRNFVTAIGHR